MSEMRRPKKAKEGFRAWTGEDIAQFEARWPSGSRERLALALLLYTGQRRQDVIVMGRQHVRGGVISVVQQKTGTRLEIPLAIPLRSELAQVPPGQLTFLQTQYGEPFTPAGFGNWFRERAQAAGLPARSNAHGLRKAAAAALAESGCTDKQIMAVTGHKNLSEVTLYTASADQARLAREAIARLEKRTKRLTGSRPVRQDRENVG
jgi:integrase